MPVIPGCNASFPQLPQFTRYFHTEYSLYPLAPALKEAHRTRQRRRNPSEEESRKRLSRGTRQRIPRAIRKLKARQCLGNQALLDRFRKLSHTTAAAKAPRTAGYAHSLLENPSRQVDAIRTRFRNLRQNRIERATLRKESCPFAFRSEFAAEAESASFTLEA